MFMAITLNFKSPNAWGETFDTFKGLYVMKDYVKVPNETNKREVRNAKNKVCRFCNKGENETTFKSLSHKIPKLLGNKFWYGDDECDSCNSLFQKYETHLADFFGLDRPLHQVKGGNKYPKFKSPGQRLEVRVSEFYDNIGVYIKQNSKQNEHFEYNKESGQLKITTELTPFVPIYVYKAFLKIALSILPKEEIKFYQELLPFILNPESTYVSFCPIAGYSLHSDARFDFQSLIFEKSNSNLKLPKHFFCFYWLNNIIIIHLPNHKNDMWIRDEFINVPVPPPLFLNVDDELLQKLKIDYFFEDFNSIDIAKNRKREIVFQINPDTMKDLVGENMETGELSKIDEFDINNISGLFISNKENIPTIYFDETGNNKSKL